MILKCQEQGKKTIKHTFAAGGCVSIFGKLHYYPTKLQMKLTAGRPSWRWAAPEVPASSSELLSSLVSHPAEVNLLSLFVHGSSWWTILRTCLKNQIQANNEK